MGGVREVSTTTVDFFIYWYYCIIFSLYKFRRAIRVYVQCPILDYAHKDPTGRYAETLFDAGMFAYSLGAYRDNPSLANALGVALDGVALGLPIPAFGGAMVRGMGVVGKGVQKLPDSALVCRGGSCSANQFRTGSGVTLDTNGKLQGVSVNSSPSASLQELTKSLPHNQIGVTRVGDIRKIGGDVILSPKSNGSNPNLLHSILQGITPQQAENLFRPTTVNPRKK